MDYYGQVNAPKHIHDDLLTDEGESAHQNIYPQYIICEYDMMTIEDRHQNRNVAQLQVIADTVWEYTTKCVNPPPLPPTHSPQNIRQVYSLNKTVNVSLRGFLWVFSSFFF